jgi:hypothetical protein
MVDKDGPTRLSADAAAANGGQSEQPKKMQTKKPRHAMSEDKPSIVANDSKRDTTMEEPPPGTSDLHNTPRGMLDRSLQAQLGRQLRAIFSDVAQEPVPDRFIKLLEDLEAREKRR